MQQLKKSANTYRLQARIYKSIIARDFKNNYLIGCDPYDSLKVDVFIYDKKNKVLKNL